jgi:hypothetical protein
LSDLADALDDNDFRSEMQANGLKGFKKAAFKKAVAVTQCTGGGYNIATESIPFQNGISHHSNSPGTPLDGPQELYCPISFVLMSDDPVVASDAFTYERGAIENWFGRPENSQGVRSPLTGELLTSLDLMPNKTVRVMAREFAQNSIELSMQGY